MRRPRHREKSSLIYKMLGFAALVGLSLAPILIGVGGSHHIRSLIPVQLVTIATPKPPPVVPKAPPPAPVHTKPLRRPHAEQVALLSPPHARKEPIPATPPKPPAKPLAKPPAKPTIKHFTKPLAKHFIKPLVKTPVKSKPRIATKPAPKPVKRPVAQASPNPSAARQALAARKARANALEKEAHKIAVAMAAHRAAKAHTASAHSRRPPVKTAAQPPVKPVHVADRPRPALPSSSPVLAPPETPDVPTPDVPASDYTPAEAVFQPQPTIPDRLLVAPLHAVCRCRFVIHADGSTTVQMLISSGRAVLDRRAMDAARRWRFRPARRDGKPVESTQTVEMTFNVRPAFGN